MVECPEADLGHPGPSIRSRSKGTQNFRREYKIVTKTLHRKTCLESL